jgi:Domain of unknown function (DUF4437)
VRPWIEFVQSQRLPWQTDHDVARLRPGSDVKVLSVDDESGATSLLVRYPPGLSTPGAAVNADEEFIVLSGSLRVGDRSFGHLAYAHWPAGHVRGQLLSESGAVVLTFFSGPPGRASGPVRNDPARLVEHLDSFTVPYTGNFHPQFPPGAGRKILYQDPVSRDTTWLLGTLPLRWGEQAEVHPTIEEMYLISGETHGNRGVMRPGAYFWRPPGIPHGPYGTLTGNLYLFRTRGGALSTRYVSAEQPFRWWPPYAPVVPEHLAAYAGEADAGADCW